MCYKSACQAGASQHIAPVFATLQWLWVKCYIDFKVLLLLYKVFKSLAPEYVGNPWKTEDEGHADFMSFLNMLGRLDYSFAGSTWLLPLQN